MLKKYYSSGVIFVFLALLGGALLSSCSTKKNTFTRRVYHNITGQYNMFWNGNESYRQGVRQFNSSVQDNYNNILPVFNYGTDTEAQSINSQMDRAIEKASINIQRHSMYFNRREYVKWIDDSYMLIGKAYFYKHEYNKARRTFEFVMNEYKYNLTTYEATLWLANSLNRTGKHQRALGILDNLKNEIKKNPKIPREVKKQLPLVQADIYIGQKRYSQARPILEEALYTHKYKKDLDARIKFILGQIYQSEEKYYVASEYYHRVIKRNPDYVMSFNAGINLAQCYDVKYGDSKRIEKSLLKMLKEDKNAGFLDQIYFALADLAFKNSNDSLAISFLRLSVATSTNNNYQKTKSALAVGDLYFNRQQYELSQAYFDTAMQVLPEDYPGYAEIASKTTYLTELVSNLIVVQEEDSLQYVAGLSEDQRNAIIDKIIQDKIEEEKRLQEEEELMAMASSGSMGMNPMDRGGMSGGPTMGAPAGTGNWYFYNPAALSQGFSEFTKKWGRRKLEDNWRLANKQASFQIEEVAIEGDSLAGDSTAMVSTDPMKRETYLANLPFTEEQLATSNERIQDALFNLGNIYKDKLKNNPRAIESFETLVQRYPVNNYLLEVYYHLHKLHIQAGNQDLAAQYKTLIVENFPDSDYAKLLTNPEYFKQLQEEKNLMATLYLDTYNAYEAGQYFTVLANSNRAVQEFTQPAELLPKFEYLRSLAIGRIEVADSLLASLEALILKYPESDVTPLAQNIVTFLKGPADTTALTSSDPVIKIDFSKYLFKPSARHIFAILVDDSKVNVEALKVKISDFNSKFYSLESLSITNVILVGDMHLIMSGNFENADKAMLYYKTILKNEYVFSGLTSVEYHAFLLSQENYPLFYKDKDLETYMAFFNDKYIKGKD